MNTTYVTKLSEAELVAKLSDQRGATILTFTAKTDARLKKTGNPYGQVYKIARVNGLVNFHYDNGVLRRLEKEGKSPEDFRKGDSWHVAVLTDDGKLTPFSVHPKTGEFYIRFLHVATLQTIYVTEDGKELTADEVAPFLPKKSEYKNQGLEDPLVFLTYKLAGIQEIVLEGETFSIEA